MKTITINGWDIYILAQYDTEQTTEQLKALMGNHMYNVNTDWDNYRRVGKKWKKK